MGQKSEIVAGLDLGSSRVSVVIMEVGEHGDRQVIGAASVPSGGGLRAGHVVSIDHTIHAIRSAVDEASRMADCEISAVRLGIGGPGTMGFNSDGTVAVRGGQVTGQDVQRVMETASAVKLPGDKKLLHTLPQEYIIDGQEGIRTPVSMTGVRLETRVHAITTSATALQNALRCCRDAGLHVERTIYAGLASSAAVLSQEERELGAVLIDVGGGTTDLAVWFDNALVHTVTLDYGGEALTRQIARGLRTPSDAAEQIKQDYGCAMASMVSDGETMEVPGVGGRDPQIRQRHVLCEILEPGLEEFLARIAEEIELAGCREHLAAGCVMTGGTSKLDAMAELGSDVLVNMPVRVGAPSARGDGHFQDWVGDPDYATSYGLCLDTFDDHLADAIRPRKPKRSWFAPVRRLINAWF